MNEVGPKQLSQQKSEGSGRNSLPLLLKTSSLRQQAHCFESAANYSMLDMNYGLQFGNSLLDFTKDCPILWRILLRESFDRIRALMSKISKGNTACRSFMFGND